MANQLLVLEWDSTAVRGVLAERSLRQTDFGEFFTELRLPDEPLSEALSRIEARLGQSARQVVLCLGARAVSTRTLMFPFSDAKKIASAIHFELENVLPFELDDSILGHHIVSKDEDHAAVLVAVTPNEHVESGLQTFSDAGLEPRHIRPSFIGLAELAKNSEAELWVNVGEEESQMVLVEEGALKFARMTRIGCNDIDRTLAGTFDLSLEQAKEARLKEMSFEDGSEDAAQVDVNDAIIEGLSRLATNIRLTLQALGDERAPSRVRITGSLANIDGAAEALSKILGIELGVLEWQEGFAEELGGGKGLSSEYASVAGMLLMQIRRGNSTEFELRRGAYAYQGDFEALRGHLFRVGVGVAVVGMVAMFSAIVSTSLLKSHEKEIDERFCTATKKTVGKEICNPLQALAVMRQPGGDLGIVLPSYAAPDIFEAISAGIKSDVDVSFDRMNITMDPKGQDPSRVEIAGDTASFDGTEAIRNQLKAAPCVRELELSKQQKSSRKKGRIEFSMKIDYQCGENETPAKYSGKGG